MKGFALSVVSVVALLLAVEGGLRIVDWFRPELEVSAAGRDIFAGDSLVGYHLWPRSRTCMRYPPGRHRVSHVVSNSDGFFSSRELGEPDPRPRVLVLGDSFTFGIGVEEGRRFTEVVEELKPGWRVDNLGMPGWGLDLMVRALETYGPKARPAVTVLAVYTDDFRRLGSRYVGVGFPIPKFVLVDGRLVSRPFPTPTFWRRLRLVEMARQALESGDRNRYRLNEALVQRFTEASAKLGARPVIVFIPGKGDTPEDRERREKLRAWAAARRVPFDDLTAAIREAGVANTYIPGNWHWNEAGHRVAGRALHQLLSGTVLAERNSVPVTPPTPPWHPPRNYCHDAAVDSGSAVADSS